MEAIRVALQWQQTSVSALQSTGRLLLAPADFRGRYLIFGELWIADGVLFGIVCGLQPR